MQSYPFFYPLLLLDTFGYALKSTLCVINGVEKQIFKDPKTDNGIKKSQKGRVAVLKNTIRVNGISQDYHFIDGLGLNDVITGDCLTEIYRDGKLLVGDTFANIRKRLSK